MKKKIILSCTVFFQFFGSAFAQDSSKIRRWEIILNITNAISRFSGNGVRNINEDPYIFAVKFNNRTNRRAFRLGFNESYTAQNTQLFPGERQSKEVYFSPIFGHEWRRHLDKHFMFYFGVDLRYGIRQNSVALVDGGFGPTLIIRGEEQAYGGGPFCGFVWKVNPRVSIFTEANLYANYAHTLRTMEDGLSTSVLENSNKTFFTPVIPSSIFVSIHF